MAIAHAIQGHVYVCPDCSEPHAEIVFAELEIDTDEYAPGEVHEGGLVIPEDYENCNRIGLELAELFMLRDVVNTCIDRATMMKASENN